MLSVKSTWLCDICKDYRNLGKSRQCNSCGAGRKKSRYVVVIQGAYYLCHLYTLKHTQLLSVLKVMPTEEIVMKVSYPSDADITLEVVVQMAKRALEPPLPKCAISFDVCAGEENSSTSPHIREDSLFQRVMDEGTKLAYDSKIGRFVPVDTVDVSPHKKLKDLSAVNTDLNYVKFMAQEKRVMKKVVQDTIAIRSRQENEYLAVPTFENCVRRPCTLCELELPLQSLPGEITFNTAANWRAEHGSSISELDHRFDAINLYDKAPLCLFCTQFFDSELATVLERGEEEVKAVKNNPKFGGADTTQVRPVSSIGRSIEISNLKMRSMRSNGALGIGTSSSVSVLEVKAKTATSMAKINSDLHLYKLKEDKILRKIYQKRKREYPNLSLDEFKVKLFEWANDSMAQPNKPETMAVINPSIPSPTEQHQALDPKSAQIQSELRRMSLPEIFLAAAKNPDFRLLADANLLRKRQSNFGIPEQKNLIVREIQEEKKQTANYDPSKDFLPTKVMTGKSKSASSISRPLNSLHGKPRLAPVLEVSLSAAQFEKKKSNSSDREEAENIRASWADILQKVSSVQQDSADENDLFLLPKLAVKKSPEKSHFAEPVSRMATSSSAKLLTRRAEGNPAKPPQSDPSRESAEHPVMRSGPATDDTKSTKAPEWKSTTNAGGVFTSVRILKLREMSKPENQKKPNSPIKKKKTANSSKKRVIRGTSEERNKKRVAEKMNKKLLADRKARKEKARNQVEQAVGAYSAQGEDMISTMKSLGFKDPDRPLQTRLEIQTQQPNSVVQGSMKRLSNVSQKHKKFVSFHGELISASVEVIKKIEELPHRPIQRTGSGLDLIRTLGRNSSQRNVLEQNGISEAVGGDLFISRGEVVNKTVSWEDAMYHDSFEDADTEEFSTGNYADDFEQQQSFSEQGYEPDFENESRAQSCVEPLGDIAMWGENLPPRAPSSHSRQRDACNAESDSAATMFHTYLEEEFESFEDPSGCDNDSQGYSSHEFEDNDVPTVDFVSEEKKTSSQFSSIEKKTSSQFSSIEFGRPTISRKGSKIDFVNTMENVSGRAFSPAKTPMSSHRKKRRSGGVVGVVDSPFQSRPSSSVSLKVMSPDPISANSPEVIEKLVPRYKRVDSSIMFSKEISSNDPELESAMQEYVDMLFSGEGVEEISFDNEHNSPQNFPVDNATVVSISKQKNAFAEQQHIAISSVEPTILSPPTIKYNPILPKDVVVNTNMSPGLSDKRSEDTFAGTKTTRSGTVLPRIAHDIKSFPSQLDLTIMKRSGEIGKKIDVKQDDDDALLAAVANRLKNITGTTSFTKNGSRKM